MNRPLGRIMLDVAGTDLSAEERERLCHPGVGGVILFSRNYRSPRQLCGLTAAIRSLRKPELLIAVDHEGGRVQRFREGFTGLPAMRRLGECWDANRQSARAAARDIGYVLAAELLACGVDFSFTPVLDIDFGPSAVIGDRAFHRSARAIAELGGALIEGLAQAGMSGVGKHFPGHGHVAADSHLAVPVDQRSLAQIRAADLLPYVALIPRGLSAVMPAHVIYPEFDSRPAGFSRKWLRLLREELGFDGLIFSDDLSMEGASVAGGVVERGVAALTAGCDMVLLCNAPQSAEILLQGLPAGALDLRRAASMRGRRTFSDLESLRASPRYRMASAGAARFSGGGT